MLATGRRGPVILQKISHYRLISELCAPGQWGAFLAKDTRSGRAVTLQVLPPGRFKSEAHFRRFAEQMRSVAALDHPNIVRVYEVGEDAGHHFVATEPVMGVTLDALLRGGKYDLRQVFDLLRQVAEGMAVAHWADILHLRLTAHDIHVVRDGPAKISGFEFTVLWEQGRLDRMDDEESDADPREAPEKGMLPHSRSGYTLEYASPEQVEGGEVDTRHDIFSFGRILYEAVTGRNPFKADHPFEAIHSILHEMPPPLTNFNPATPREAQVIVRRCLAKDPEKRYPMIKDAAIELKNLLSGRA